MPHCELFADRWKKLTTLKKVEHMLNEHSIVYNFFNSTAMTTYGLILFPVDPLFHGGKVALGDDGGDGHGY